MRVPRVTKETGGSVYLACIGEVVVHTTEKSGSRSSWKTEGYIPQKKINFDSCPSNRKQDILLNKLLW